MAVPAGCWAASFLLTVEKTVTRTARPADLLHDIDESGCGAGVLPVDAGQRECGERDDGEPVAEAEQHQRSEQRVVAAGL